MGTRKNRKLFLLKTKWDVVNDKMTIPTFCFFGKKIFRFQINFLLQIFRTFRSLQFSFDKMHTNTTIEFFWGKKTFSFPFKQLFTKNEKKIFSSHIRKNLKLFFNFLLSCHSLKLSAIQTMQSFLFTKAEYDFLIQIVNGKPKNNKRIQFSLRYLYLLFALFVYKM